MHVVPVLVALSLLLHAVGAGAGVVSIPVPELEGAWQLGDERAVSLPPETWPAGMTDLALLLDGTASTGSFEWCDEQEVVCEPGGSFQGIFAVYLGGLEAGGDPGRLPFSSPGPVPWPPSLGFLFLGSHELQVGWSSPIDHCMVVGEPLCPVERDPTIATIEHARLLATVPEPADGVGAAAAATTLGCVAAFRQRRRAAR
jgi:hypothetical protein